MNGKTHKAIGVATGVAVAVVGFTAGSELAPLALVTAPFGAMLPDIDHDMTAMGRKRKKVTDTLKVIVPIAIIALLALIGAEYYSSRDLAGSITKAAFVLIPVLVLGILSKIPVVRNQWKWATKHRGFMHTLAIPIVLIVLLIKGFDNSTLQWLVVGLTAGYLSHLFADSITVERCPLLWPITTKPIGVSLVSTQNKSEMIAGVIICIVEVALAVVYAVGV